MSESDYLVRVRFHVELGEHDVKMLDERIVSLGKDVQIPDVPTSAKEHGVDKIDFLTIEVFQRIK